jgi:hypothetical protein
VYVCASARVCVSWSKISAVGGLWPTEILKVPSDPRVKVSWKNVLGLPRPSKVMGS